MLVEDITEIALPVNDTLVARCALLLAESGKVELAKLLLAREDLDVNAPYINDSGRTALMIAARCGDEVDSRSIASPTT